MRAGFDAVDAVRLAIAVDSSKTHYGREFCGIGPKCQQDWQRVAKALALESSAG